MKVRKAAIISIGDELLLGQTVDTNAAWLSEQLARLGVELCEHVTVGDDVGAISEQLRRLGAQVDVIIASGGLGPTDDDLTRNAVAEVLGTELRLYEPWLVRMASLFADRGREMPLKNRVQAMIPGGCEPLDNPLGTACGISAQMNRAGAYFVPGVPAEMKAIFTATILPALKPRAETQPSGRVIITRTLRCFGAGESSIAEMLGAIMRRGRNPLVNSTVADGIISIRINAAAENEPAARQLIEPIERQTRQRLGDLVFGCDEQTLAIVAGRLLQQGGVTLATAESCTGGLLAKMITDVPGASEYFQAGWISYSNRAKTDLLDVSPAIIERCGAVSAEVAAQLADGARRLAGSDYALSTTGIAGPGGGTPEKPIGLVFIGLAAVDGVEVVDRRFHGDRAAVRRWTVNTALDILRRRLQA